MTEKSRDFSEMGRKGGKAKVPKGFALMNKERLKEISSKAGKKSKRKKLPKSVLKDISPIGDYEDI